MGGSTVRCEVFGVLPFARICLLAARGGPDEPWRMPPSESFHCEICFTLSASSEPASPTSEGLEPFDLREIGGQSRARELRELSLDGRRCKVKRGVRCGARKLRRFRRAVFSAKAPKRNKGEMPRGSRRGMSLPTRTFYCPCSGVPPPYFYNMD